MAIIEVKVGVVWLPARVQGIGAFLDAHAWVTRRELIVELAEVEVARHARR